MLVLFKIAARNLLQHKVKTLIIGSILALGMIVLVLGNSLMGTITAGTKQTYIESFSGHFIISSTDGDAVSLLSMRQNLTASNSTIPVVPDYFKIEKTLEENPDIAAFSPQTSGMVQMNVNDQGMGIAQLFGIDVEQYVNMFPDNIEITTGGFWKNGHQGILLSPLTTVMLQRTLGRNLKTDEMITMTTTSGGSITIREVPYKGTFHFLNAVNELNMISLVDIDTLRSLNGMTIGSGMVAELSEEDTKYLEMDANTMFQTAEVVEEEAAPIADSIYASDDTGTSRKVEVKAGANEDDFYNILGDTTERDRLARTDSGAYSYILVRLAEGAREGQVRRDLEAFFDRELIDAQVISWLDGAGPTAKMAYNIKNIFNVIVLIIAVVAVIIIMNTLVISISERIPEIGTVRALGGQKGFVRNMIMSETFLISIVFGFLGIVVSLMVLWTAGQAGIAAPNVFFRALFGGEYIYPVLDAGSLLVAFATVVGVALLSCVYPVSIAVGIAPVKAIQTE